MDEYANDRHPEAKIRQLSELPLADNRRRHARYAVELDVSVSSEHNFYAGFAENLSEGGVFVATHSLKPAGSIIELAINLPESTAPIHVRGEVRWIREYHEGSGLPPGMGIRFIDLGSEAAHAINAFLSHREPLFYDDE